MLFNRKSQDYANFFRQAYHFAGGRARGGLLAGLGLSPEAWSEAVAAAGDLEIDLDASFPLVKNNALWDGLVDLVHVESPSAARAREADLAALDLPPAILERAGADVTPETRADLVKRLRAAGRSEARAKKDMEILARFASIISRITGTNPNAMIKERFRFGKEGAGAGVAASLSQAAANIPASDPRVTFRKGMKSLSEVKIIDGGFLDGEITFEQAKATAGKFSQQTVTNADLGQSIRITNSGIQETMRHRPSQADLKAFSVLPEMLESAQWVRKDPNIKDKQGQAEILFLYAPVRLGNNVYAAQINVKRNVDGALQYYGHFLKKTEGGPATWGGESKNDSSPAMAPLQAIRIIDLLEKIKNRGSRLPADISSLYQARETGPRGRLEILADRSFRVIFTDAADVSTAVHEFAHLFRELAQWTLETPPEKIVDQDAFQRLQEGWREVEAWLARFDDEAALKAEYDRWLKPNFGGREFEALTPEEKARARDRAGHEYFARGFETYLMEGKAPTAGLKRLFSQMKQWLLNLYKDLTGGLGVELNDGVRRFFDNLLATEEELAMESWRGQEVFSAEEMGSFREIDPRAMAEYEAAADQARQKAAEEITVARVAGRESLRRQWKREAKPAAREHPSQRLINDIISQGGINLKSLRTSYDDDKIRPLIKKRPGLVSKNGIGFDELAEMYGFDSDDFIQNLLDSPNLKQLADEYVAQREDEYEHYEGRLEAPISDAEIELWERERNLWARFMLPKDSKYAPRSARDLRRVIEEKTGLLTVDEIKRQNAQDLKASLKAQARAAREGYKAGLEEGQTAGLMAGVREGTLAGRREGRLEALEKRLELGLKYQEQIKRQREIAAFEAQAGRIRKQKTAQPDRFGGILPEYHDQVINLLAAAGFCTDVPASSSLAEFATRLEADGVGVEVADWLRDGRAWTDPETGRRRTYRSLNLPDLRDLRKAVDNLTTLGRRQQQVRVDGQLVGENEAQKNMEIPTRFTSIINRITGENPNSMSKEGFRVGTEGTQGAGISYHQLTPEQIQAADTALARDVAAWEKTVDDYIAGKLSETKQVTMLRQTPLVLQMIGAKNRRLMVNYGKLKEILVTKHQLPVETLKQVPAAMTDPIMIFKSDSQGGDWVMMLDLKDQHGATVIVPVLLEGIGESGYAVNIVKSVYGQKNTETLRPNNHWFANQIAKGNLIYRNNKKSREWAGSVGLQLPPGGTPSNATRNKIYNYKDFVKFREGHPGLYQPALARLK